MRVALINDTHYGCRKGSKLFHDYFELFYKNIFFPTLQEQGITTIIHMGDAFDSRKSIDYQSLQWAKRVVFEPLKNYEVHMIVGNHDSYYKNTNNTNSPQLLLKDYSNIKTYSSPTEIKIGSLDILLLPWICEDNQEKSFKMIKKTKAKVAMGHLELNGFRANSKIIMDHGLEANLFSNFKKVFSGHYHTRSDNGTVFYTGNPYEIYWTDVNDTRGFTIFDTETLEHTYVNNPYKIFYNVYYDNNGVDLDVSEYENKIVKVIVRKKDNHKEFEKFIDKLYSSKIAELKIVENFDIDDSEKVEVFESEDTFTILNSYVENSEVNLDKSKIQKLLYEVYQEACELV